MPAKGISVAAAEKPIIPDAGGQKEQQPAGAFFAIGAPCEPCECERLQRADGAGESRGDFGLAGESLKKIALPQQRSGGFSNHGLP
jgi:hypothetical protein